MKKSNSSSTSEKQIKIDNGGSSRYFLQSLYEKEVQQLWKWYESERKRIIEEEYQKDWNYHYPDVDDIYYENYTDHWRIDELLHKVHCMEDEIAERYS